MKHFALPLALSLIGSAAFAYDSDPGYGARGEATPTRGSTKSSAPTYYYKPTMRYYGKDYVVTYRFVQWNDRMNRSGGGGFGSQASVPVSALQAGPGSEPKVTYRISRTEAAAPAVRPSSAAPAKEVPPIADKKK